MDEITTPGEDGRPVVERPEKGWLQLRDRLLADLGAEQRRVLPIQLAVALDALRRRPWLTVEQYRRDGGLPGLERLHVEGHLADAARRALPYAAMLAHATVGLDPFGKRSSEMVSDCLEPLFRGPEPPGEVVFLAAQLLINFNFKDAQPLAKLLLKRMAMEENDISFSRDWDETLGALAAMLDPEDVPAGTIARVAEWKRDRERERQRGRQPVDPDLDELRQVLRRLGVDSDPKDLRPGAAALLKQIETEREADGSALLALGQALGRLTPGLSQRELSHAAEVLIPRLAAARHEWIYHTYEWNRGYYGDLEDLAELLAAADHQSLVDLLKSMPGAMPPIRAAALGALECKTGAKFDGDLWKFVDWATTDPEGRALELRLE